MAVCLIMVAAVCLLLNLAAAGSVRALENPWVETVHNFESLNTWMRRNGVTLHLTYTGEAKHGFGTIPDDMTQYRGLFELSLGLDTDQLNLWKNGRLFLSWQNGHGDQVTIAPGGNPLSISDIDAPDFTQVSQYGLDQSLLDGKLNLLIGKQDVNTYFCANNFGSQFIFPAYTLIPTVTLPTFPEPALGLTVLGRVADRVHLKAGIYDGAPEIGTSGWDTTFDGSGGYFQIFESGVRVALGKNGDFGGNYQTGVWYHTGPAELIGHPGSETGNYGFYIMANQMVYKEPGTATADEGLGLFFQLGWAPEDRNTVNQYIGAGLTYTGLLPGRAQDTFGLGMGYTRLTGQSPGQAETSLTHTELYYNAHIAPSMHLQPDLQYFNTPGTDQDAGWAAIIRWILAM